MFVVKRNGKTVPFDEDRIKSSIFKACINGKYKGTDEQAEKIASVVTKSVVETLSGIAVNIHDIDTIQNVTINHLFAKNKVVANDYAHYKTDRDVQRMQSRDINVQVQKLLSNDRTIVNENANKDSNTFSTRRDLTAGTTAKAIGLDMLPPHIAKAHEDGDIHFHDLDYSPYEPITNCCLIDFDFMFKNGFQIGNADVETPKSIQTASAQLCQVIANVASQQFGGTSVNRIDQLLAPYAELNFEKHLKTAREWIPNEKIHEAFAYEKTQKDIYDSIQSIEYEINTLYTSNGQTPFTTIGFGLGESWFEREIQKAILQVRINGLSGGKTAIFPKLLYSIRDGVNRKPEDPNYDIKRMALECSSKRMYPDILNYDKLIELTGSFKASMGCRSFLQGWKDENGIEKNSGRMNLGVVTLNLPRIAMESKGNKELFWRILSNRIRLTGDALLYRVKRVKEAFPKNAPILYMHGAFGKKLEADGNVDEVFNNRRATVSFGYIGLYEVASVFYGGDWENNKEAKDFTLDILKTIKEYTDRIGDEHGYHFSVYATPSESLTDRFCRMDTEKFGIVKNITDKDYYTNSFHYDVRKNPTPFEKLEFEKDYPVYSSGGFIHYVEYPILTHNLDALEAVWDYSYDKVGYLGTNTPIDYCYECEYKGDFDPTERGFRCPECGNTDPERCDVVKRTCGLRFPGSQ